MENIFITLPEQQRSCFNNGDYFLCFLSLFTERSSIKIFTVCRVQNVVL